MAMYSFVPAFREAKFCGVPSCVFDKLGCAAGEKRLRDTTLEEGLPIARSVPLFCDKTQTQKNTDLPKFPERH
jgi:hypothetical protein